MYQPNTPMCMILIPSILQFSASVFYMENVKCAKSFNRLVDLYALRKVILKSVLIANLYILSFKFSLFYSYHRLSLIDFIIAHS